MIVNLFMTFRWITFVTRSVLSVCECVCVCSCASAFAFVHVCVCACLFTFAFHTSCVLIKPRRTSTSQIFYRKYRFEILPNKLLAVAARAVSLLTSTTFFSTPFARAKRITSLATLYDLGPSCLIRPATVHTQVVRLSGDKHGPRTWAKGRRFWFICFFFYPKTLVSGASMANFNISPHFVRNNTYVD